MAQILQTLVLNETIVVGSFKVEVDRRLKVEALKFDNGEIKVKYTNEKLQTSYVASPIPKEYSKIVWQKAQQQIK